MKLNHPIQAWHRQGKETNFFSGTVFQKIKRLLG